MATTPTVQEPQVQDFAVNGGSFRGTQDQYSQYLSTHPQISSTPQAQVQAPNTLTASELGGSKVNVPDLPSVSNTDSFVQTLFQQYNQPVQALEQKQTDLSNQLTTASTKLGEKGNALLAKENELGVTADTARLKDLNTSIATKTAEYQNRIAALPGQGRGITTGLVAAQTDREKRMAAVELGGLASVAQALQGNIALSQDMAQRAVDLEFAPVEQEIKNLQTLLQLNEQNFTRAESKRAAQINIALQERQRQLEEDKANKLAIFDTAKQAALAGADNATIQKVLKASDKEAAFNLVAPIISAQVQKERKFAEEDRALDNQYKKAQIQNIYSEINKRTTENKFTQVDTSFLQNPNLTTSEKNGMLVTALLQNPKLGQATRTAVTPALGVIKALEDVAVANPTGKFAGVNPINALLNAKIPFTNIGIPFRETFKKQESIKNEGYVEAIGLKVQQWASGASLTKQQTEAVQKLVPKVSDTDANFKTKVNNLANFMLSQVAANLQSEGVNFQPEQLNLFETSDLLKKASPEQVKELEKAGLIKK